MAEAFEEASDAFEFGRDLRRRGIVAPLLRERDPEPSRIALDHLLIRLRRGPERHQFAGRRTAAGVDEGGGIAYRARLAALDRYQARQIRKVRREREHAVRDLQSDIAVDAGRNP